MTRVKVWLLVAVIVGGAFGCGGDDDDDTPAAGTDATGGTGMTTGGTGGATGGTTATTGGGGGTGATAMPVECGSTSCQPIMLPFMIPAQFEAIASAFIPAVCCVDAAAGECGYSMQGGPCMPPPPSDERCPMSTTLPIPTCCGGNGMCGIAAMEGSCMDPGMLGALLGLSPSVCDPSLVGGDEDAGTP